MPVNQSDLNFFLELSKLMGSSNEIASINTLRQTIKRLKYYAGDPAPITYKDIFMKARDGYSLRLRKYEFDNEIRPLIIYFPGNGFIYDLFEENHAIISKISDTACCHAIMVDFRLAPENPYPKPLEDALDAISFIFKNINFLNINPNKVILAGYSSGANLAAVATNQLRNQAEIKIYCQLLISGAYDYTDSLHEFDNYALQDKMLDPSSAKFSFDCYSKESQRKEPTCSPYWEKDLSGLPPTIIMMGEYDGGRSQGEAYANKLIAANNQVEKIIGKGQTHGTILYRKACVDGPDPAIIAGQKLKNYLG